MGLQNKCWGLSGLVSSLGPQHDGSESGFAKLANMFSLPILFEFSFYRLSQFSVIGKMEQLLCMEVLTPSSNALNWCASLFHTGSLCDENNPPAYLETHSPRLFCFGFDSKLVESGLELIFGVCAQSWCNFGPPCRPDGLDIPKAKSTISGKLGAWSMPYLHFRSILGLPYGYCPAECLLLTRCKLFDERYKMSAERCANHLPHARPLKGSADIQTPDPPPWRSLC